VPTENVTVRVSTLSQRISAMPTKRVGCASSCRSGGHDRCKFLLGYTVQCADWDGRYSAASKREAAKTDYHITPEHDPFSEFHTNAHPCLVNYAYELLIEQERDKKKTAPKHDEPER